MLKFEKKSVAKRLRHVGGGGREVYLHSFLTFLLSEGEWSASPLCPLSSRYPLNSRLGGLQNQSGYFGQQKILLASEENRTTAHSAHGLVTTN